MEQQEQAQWDAVNRMLLHHGFKPVSFADPTENKNLAEPLLLDGVSASELRATLKTMLTDSERRQGLIQELVQSNSQLKQEAEQQQTRAARQTQKASDLQGVLEGVKTRVQELEDSYLSKAAQQRARSQQEKNQAENLTREKELVSRLQEKVRMATQEEERRVARQNQAFQKIQRRSARHQSAADQQILEIVDLYESQLQQLRLELIQCKSSSGESEPSDSQNKAHVTSKALVKSYQEQLRDVKAQREDLRAEVQRLKEELDSRPTVKELKSYKQQLRRMDLIIQQSNISLHKSSQGQNPEDLSETHSTGISGVQHPDSSTCRTHLMDVCKELGVQDVTRAVTAVKAQTKRAESATKLRKMLSDITTVLTNPSAPLGLLRQRSHDVHQQGEFELILPTLDVWSRQLNSLGDLHRNLTRLQKRLSPWQPSGAITPADAVTVQDLMLVVDMLLDETVTDNKVLQSPTRHTLESMIGHFQKLFDVPSLAGVYPRMNDVYTKLSEMNNAMRNLRDLLNLEARAPPSEVVNSVAAAVSARDGTPGQELWSLLEVTDIDSIIVKLKEHEEFFPVFHWLALELLRELDVQTLDDVLPAVLSLKASALNKS